MRRASLLHTGIQVSRPTPSPDGFHIPSRGQNRQDSQDLSLHPRFLLEVADANLSFLFRGHDLRLVRHTRQLAQLLELVELLCVGFSMAFSQVKTSLGTARSLGQSLKGAGPEQAFRCDVAILYIGEEGWLDPGRF
jgi:hypothetical protein